MTDEETEKPTQENETPMTPESRRKAFFICAGILTAAALAAGFINGFPGSEIPLMFGAVGYIGGLALLAIYFGFP